MMMTIHNRNSCLELIQNTRKCCTREQRLDLYENELEIDVHNKNSLRFETIKLYIL